MDITSGLQQQVWSSLGREFLYSQSSGDVQHMTYLFELSLGWQTSFLNKYDGSYVILTW